MDRKLLRIEENDHELTIKYPNGGRPRRIEKKDGDFPFPRILGEFVLGILKDRDLGIGYHDNGDLADMELVETENALICDYFYSDNINTNWLLNTKNEGFCHLFGYRLLDKLREGYNLNIKYTDNAGSSGHDQQVRGMEGMRRPFI